MRVVPWPQLLLLSDVLLARIIGAYLFCFLLGNEWSSQSLFRYDDVSGFGYDQFSCDDKYRLHVQNLSTQQVGIEFSTHQNNWQRLTIHL